MIYHITGHTSGLGKALHKLFPDAQCYSRSNGFDIKHPANIISKIDQSQRNVFINNAYDGFAQVDLLFEVFNTLKESNSLIINVSSNSGDGIKSFVHPYAIHKSALDKASEQLSYISETEKNPCSVSNIRFGYLDTPRTKHVTEKKIHAGNAASYINFIIDNWKKNIYIKNLTIVP